MHPDVRLMQAVIMSLLTIGMASCRLSFNKLTTGLNWEYCVMDMVVRVFIIAAVAINIFQLLHDNILPLVEGLPAWALAQ
jgi:hypothetical protein